MCVHMYVRVLMHVFFIDCFVYKCDCAVSQHSYLGLLPLHLTQISFTGQQDSVEIQTVVSVPKGPFKVCSTSEQGNKP